MRKINKVLLIDDDKAANFLNQSVIENLGFANEIILKTNGKEAIEYLNEECESGRAPDLVLLDLKMPVMDGFDFLKEYERVCHDQMDKISVVILTSSRDADDYLKLVQMGSHYVITKPLTKEKLIDIHHRYFRNEHP